MSTAFPRRVVSKSDPDYLKWFRNLLVLKARSNGVSAFELAQIERDFQDLLEAKMLADFDEIEHSSFGGQELTLERLKVTVAEIILRSREAYADWIDGCVGIAILHPPDRTEKLVSLFAKLPLHHIDTDMKQMSVCADDETYALTIQTYENKFMPPAELCMWLVHPTDPAAEVIVGDSGSVIQFSDIYADNEELERFAVYSFCRALVKDTEVEVGDLCLPQYEPLGPSTFPDFELTIRNEEWAVEVTRVESEMVTYHLLSDPLDRKTMDKVRRAAITDSKINEALKDSLESKTEKLGKCEVYSRACLLLVDTIDAIEPDNSAHWRDVDLSAYEVVALVRRDGSVTFIKGKDIFGNIY